MNVHESVNILIIVSLVSEYDTVWFDCVLKESINIKSAPKYGVVYISA